MKEEYRDSCEKTSETLSEAFGVLVTPEEVYKVIEDIDIEWARNLFKPLDNPIIVEFALPQRFK